MTVHRPLPGVTFRVEPPASADPLPRMDVAAFVGFAERGPLDTPVAVEDHARFAEIFGAALRLAWDSGTGSWQTSGLAGAVADFFAQGGRRCWVVRVAGPSASVNHFPLAGVLAADPSGLRPAFARARSVGSWSDALECRAGLLIEPLGGAALPARLDGGTALAIELPTEPPISAGDLLLLEVGRWLAFLAVDGSRRLADRQRVSGTATWLRPFGPFEVVAGAVRDETAGGTWNVGLGTLRYEALDGTLHLETTLWDAAPAPVPGAWLTLHPSDASGPLWLLFEVPEAGGARIAGAWREGRPADHETAGLTARAARLTFTLRVRGESSLPAELPSFGFVVGHPRFWAALPDDDTLFSSDDGRPPSVGSDPADGLLDAARTPRFPLAGPVDPAPAYLPLGLLAGAATWSGRHGGPTSPELAPVRDGLVPPGERPPGLPDDAWKQLLAARPDVEWRERLRNLTGADWAELTAAITIDPALELVGESALLSDAFERRLMLQQPLRGLHAVLPIEEVSLLSLPDAAQRGWKLVEGLAVPEPTLETPPVPTPCPGHDLFKDCAPDDVAPQPDPHPGPLPEGEGSVSPLHRNGVGLGVGLPTVLTDAYLPDGLLRVQQAAARLAAARADLVAVLGLPRHYRPAEALEHRRALADLLDRGGSSTSSYTALYHPWIVVREADGTLRRSGPEGAACGTIAARTLARGAWVAPANQVIRNALALDPAPSSDEQAALYDASINVLGQTARGFVVLGAQTLSPDPDPMPLNVRRLLIVLRRLALREGQTYVFAPHSPAFRRRVKTGFDRHLAGMFARGAFAGHDPALAYQVVVDESVNPPSAVEQGRLVVELKVAPSQPLTYIVVRLIQSGPGTVTVQEV
jgi:hypothetical protein